MLNLKPCAMKSIYDILDSTPVKETVTIRFIRPDGLDGNGDIHIDEVRNVTEEQVRWLQYQIAIGEYNDCDAYIVNPDGTHTYFKPDGRLMPPVTTNTMSLNDELAFALLEARVGIHKF